MRILQNIKANYNTLAFDLLENNQYEKALKVVNFLNAKFHGKNIQLDHTSINTTELLFKLDEKEKAKLLAERISAKLKDYWNIIAHKINWVNRTGNCNYIH